MITRGDLKRRIKLSEGLSPDVEDGLLTDEVLNIAINDAIDLVAWDCNLLPVRKTLALQAGQNEYPMDIDVNRIRRIYHKDANGTNVPLIYVSFEEMEDWLNKTDTSSEPSYYTYNTYQPEVIQFYIAAPSIYDYSDKSYVTTGSIRTIIDSGANFGKTLSGTRIKPGFMIFNESDDSFGYVEVLDMTTTKRTGSPTFGTNNSVLYEAGQNFTNLNIQDGDIICAPGTGAVGTYAFVDAVHSDHLEFSDIQGLKSRFETTETYKVGRATEIKLSTSVPHPGLRNGVSNVFNVGTAKATITATTFTATTCTGNGTSGAETGDTAIAEGGSHGQITAVYSGYVTVDMWIGGQPSANEVVTVKRCDEYSVSARNYTERILEIGPVVSVSDSVGLESISIYYNRSPLLPTNDRDNIEIPDAYIQPLMRCLEWQTAILGNSSLSEVNSRETIYERAVIKYQAKIFDPPIAESISAWKNRHGNMHFRGYRDQTRSGVRYKLPI